MSTRKDFQNMHYPVLWREVLAAFKDIKAAGLLIDATQGLGGHSKKILEKFPQLEILGLDIDAQSQEIAKSNLEPWAERLSYQLGWFDDFFARKESERQKYDAVLFDLGISTFHYQSSERGFSFNGEEPLDMRLNIGTGRSAKDIVMGYSEYDLRQIFYKYGEESFARQIAHKICQERRRQAIKTAGQLAAIVSRSIPKKFHGRFHPATKVFQALRICVNNELDRLQKALKLSFESLNAAGIISVISFHSLEDRIVKHTFRKLAQQGRALRLNKKPIQAGPVELEENRASRSSKLRSIQKLN